MIGTGWVDGAWVDAAWVVGAWDQSVASQDVTDTDILQLPVDYQLAGKVPPIKRFGNTLEVSKGKGGERVVVSSTRSVRLKGDGPSFTVTESGRGY